MTETFADLINRTVPDVARIVGRREAERPHSDASTLLVQMEEQINTWRQQ